MCLVRGLLVAIAVIGIIGVVAVAIRALLIRARTAPATPAPRTVTGSADPVYLSPRPLPQSWLDPDGGATQELPVVPQIRAAHAVPVDIAAELRPLPRNTGAHWGSPPTPVDIPEPYDDQRSVPLYTAVIDARRRRTGHSGQTEQIRLGGGA